jgi:hypothetical protein
MAKYSKEQLKEMATVALGAKAANNPKYNELIATLQVFTGWPAFIIEHEIRALKDD